MKPQNKFQKSIVDASKKLKPISAQQIEWGRINALDHFAQRTAKGVVTCTECGQKWEDKSQAKKGKCPNCQTKLTIETTRKKIFDSCGYMTVIDACGGFQVIRTIIYHSRARVDKGTTFSQSEVMQRWLAPNGKYSTIARMRQTMGTCCIDSWIYGSDLELRRESTNNKFYINIFDSIGTGVVYPRFKLIPELKRAGVKNSIYGIKPFLLFRTLFNDSRAETLIKAKQTKVLKNIIYDGWREIDNYWPSLRIVIRNGYKIKDASLWCDYIDSLRYLDKDLCNAHYVCPNNLNAEHDRYLSQKQRLQERRAKEEKLRKLLENEENYKKEKGHFFGLAFSEGKLKIRVIESVAEMIEEGQALKHCVSSYHSKKDSLILSATVNGKRMETIELSLTNLTVLQCRGACNKNTKHHSNILKLVNANLNKIQQRLSA